MPGDSETAFDLKRRGGFDEALEAYAAELRRASQAQNQFIEEICFEQMFDIVLLKQLRQGARFRDRKVLLRKVQTELSEQLERSESYNADRFQYLMARCKRKLGGKGASTFSVDQRWLLEDKEGYKREAIGTGK